MQTEVLDRLKSTMQGPLPGLKAQMEMAPHPRAFQPPASTEPRQAGVLLLLYPAEGELHVALTVRNSELGYHRGQVSLPGGGMEEIDDSLEAAALREAEEEVGVEAAKVDVLGPLTPLYVPPSNNCIHPFVGYTSQRPRFVLDRSEVEALLEVRISELLDAENRQEEEWIRDGAPYTVPFFALQGHKVWGATAMILVEFVTLLADNGEEQAK